MDTSHAHTTIRKLKIRGPTGVEERVRNDIEQADWHAPRNDEIIFIRRLEAKASLASIGQALTDELHRTLTSNTNSHQVIRFATRQEMTAHLLTDICENRVAEKWYWRQFSTIFSLSTSRALVSIMADNLQDISAISVELSRLHKLARVWHTLTGEDGEQLAKELVFKNGYSLDALSPQHITQTVQPVPSIAPHLLQRWQPVFQSGNTTAGIKLAALIIAQESIPLLLLHAPSETLTAVESQLLGEEEKIATLETPPTNKASRRTSTPAVTPGQHAAGSQPQGQNFKATSPLAPRLSAKYKRQDSSSTPLNDAPTRHRIITSQPDESKNAADRMRTHPLKSVSLDSRAPVFFGQRFITTQGGVLYLLNFLNRDPLPSIMARHHRTIPNGWTWLYRVAQLLDLDEDESLTTFLATQLGFDTPTGLANLPELPERTRISNLANSWYDRSTIWQPSLLHLPAEIHFTTSHVDMYADVHDVRIDLRLVGLDHNPGWLPWLGRVVQFHFQSPTPQTTRQGGDSHE